MPPTVGSLLDWPELELRPVVATDRQRTVGWVHVSELDDPTDYLSGDELLLTTGLHATESAQHWDDYVRRLARNGVAAVGFGLGTRFDEVPSELVAAASRHGLPLLAVPEPVPFIAISSAVAAAWSRDERRLLTSAVDTQRDLLRAALSSVGPRAVIERLATALSAWVLLLDADGQLWWAHPEQARRHLARIQLDIERLGTNRLGAASLTAGADSVALLPITVRSELGGYLVVGRPSTLTAVEHAVLTTAAGLLALDLSATWDSQHSRRRAVLAVLQLAVAGQGELAGQVSDTLGVAIPDPPVRVAVLGAPSEHRGDLLRAAEAQQGLRVAGALAAEYEPGRVAVLLPVAEGDLLALEEVLHQVPNAKGAVSEGVPFTELADAWRRARSVFLDAETPGTLLATKDVATAGLLAQLNTPGSLDWAATLLEPLDRQSGKSRLSLLSTLRVFLAHNGQIEASAVRLGIHRHTLRYRLDRITELLGRDLDDPTTRAELWIALRLREVS